MSAFDPVTLYTKEISSTSNGLAIWHPHPGIFRDNQKKLKFRPHVRPGDVGYMETDGTFVRLFNIHLESDHSDQVLNHVLCTHLRGVRIVFSRPKSKCMSINFCAQNLFMICFRSNPINLDGGIAFSVDHNTSAFAFIHDGMRERCLMIKTYKEQIIKNGSYWLLAAQSRRDNLDAENLILVTGCTRVQSWVTGIARSQSQDVDLTLSIALTPVPSSSLQILTGVQGHENWTGSVINPGPTERKDLISSLDLFPESDSSPSDISDTELAGGSTSHTRRKKETGKQKAKGKGKAKRRQITEGKTNASNGAGTLATLSPPLDPHKATPDQTLTAVEDILKWADQCVFIRGFRMKRRVAPKRMIPKVLKAAAEPQDLSKHSDSDEENLLYSPTSKEEEDEEEETKAWDHMHAALDYILDKSDAEIALVHEDDLLGHAKLIEAKEKS
ncbi:hypothetical protein GYMLUDRAFT_418450 [Collybiopsis luxurians FD-317 M1]|uniref:Uncharacterized protein n=1 Tax=Collybiopsis luxurians FD-317 M1 TaxID=944289 RepID=A0A0D0C7T0_9AGAR|nr:hypothetical protein GYMLUDRAFT_418450 [Collybiopsis luxurians FD-317 M1]